MALIRCEKCGAGLDDKNFFTYKNGSKMVICKKCLIMHVDYFNPDTFTWILQDLDVPYIPKEWNAVRDKAYAKDPKKMSGVIGKYLSKMKLTQWNSYGWADTEVLAEKERKALEEMEAQAKEREEALRAKLEAGEISEAQYKTLTATTIQHNDFISGNSPVSYGGPPSPEEDLPKYLDEAQIDEMIGTLDEADQVEMALKWGRFYKPTEWIQLEKLFREMQEAYGLDEPDSIMTLIHVCKNDLKMNQCLDAGDIETYQKLSKVQDALRKSLKITANQNKEQKDEYMDAVGVLVAYCEEHGGAIPKFDISVAQDIVDVVIKDNQTYVKSLIKEDQAISQLIENYIKKREQLDEQKRQKELEELGIDTSVSDEDIAEYRENQRRQAEQDAEILEEGAEDET